MGRINPSRHRDGNPPCSAMNRNQALWAFLVPSSANHAEQPATSAVCVIRPSAKEFFTKGDVSVTQLLLQLALNRKLMPREPNPSPDSSPQSPIRVFSYSWPSSPGPDAPHARCSTLIRTGPLGLTVITCMGSTF
jgi:hypothetical protein